jgi:hypothetical protein
MSSCRRPSPILRSTRGRSRTRRSNASPRVNGKAGSPAPHLFAHCSAAGSGAAYILNLTATPEIAVEQPVGNDLTDGTASLDVGSGLVGGTSSLTFTIRNPGTYDLTGLNLSFTGPQLGDFVVTSFPTVPVPPAGSTTFTVRFSPGASGARSAVLHFLSNDSDESPFDIPLTGAGLTPEQLVYLKASNSGALDNFGYTVAMSGDTVVVGVPYEDSAGTGVNGDQSDNSATNAGAAYVFVRSGATWSQQAYLKASNTEAGDVFGHAVAMSGDTVVVSAFLEDSNATGVNGTQSDNSAAVAGAAYIFTGIGAGVTVTITRDGSGGYFLRWRGIPGLTYRLLRAATPTGSWSTLASTTAPGSGDMAYQETSPFPGRAFYRVAVGN